MKFANGAVSVLRLWVQILRCTFMHSGALCHHWVNRVSKFQSPAERNVKYNKRRLGWWELNTEGTCLASPGLSVQTQVEQRLDWTWNVHSSRHAPVHSWDGLQCAPSSHKEKRNPTQAAPLPSPGCSWLVRPTLSC